MIAMMCSCVHSSAMHLRLGQAEALELAEVARAALGGVVGDEEDRLAHLAQLLEHLRHAIDQRVTLPDHAVAVKDEDVRLVEKLRRDRELLAEAGRLWRGTEGPAFSGRRARALVASTRGLFTLKLTASAGGAEAEAITCARPAW